MIKIEVQIMNIFLSRWRTVFQYSCLLVMSIVFCVSSFWLGRTENLSHQQCDPFQLIRNPLTTTPPAIDQLLKKAK